MMARFESIMEWKFTSTLMVIKNVRENGYITSLWYIFSRTNCEIGQNRSTLMSYNNVIWSFSRFSVKLGYTSLTRHNSVSPRSWNWHQAVLDSWNVTLSNGIWQKMWYRRCRWGVQLARVGPLLSVLWTISVFNQAFRKLKLTNLRVFTRFAKLDKP